MPPCKTINFYYELSLMSQNPPVGRFWPLSACRAQRNVQRSASSVHGGCPPEQQAPYLSSTSSIAPPLCCGPVGALPPRLEGLTAL
jgi:hypothetical protein